LLVTYIDLSKKQQLTRLRSKIDARGGCGGFVAKGVQTMRYSLKNLVVAAWTALTCLALLGALPASADTTYYYIGKPYTYNSDPTNLGTNMTGSVTFNFDTSNATGTYYLSGGSITDLQLTSGIYSVDASVFFPALTYFVLTSGSITGWQFPTSFTHPIFSSFNGLIGGCCPFSADQIVTGGGPGVVIGAWNGFTAGPTPGIPSGFTANPGSWTIGPSPAPPPPNPVLPDDRPPLNPPA
jgi:hypothetical protein